MKKLLVCAALVTALLAVSGVALAAPDSDAESIAILAPLIQNPNGYWWDHPDLTLAVTAQKNLDPAYIAEVHRAVATWSAVLEQEFDGVITLTDVTGTERVGQADIRVHLVERIGGIVFGGKALCQKFHCSNVIVSVVGPKPFVSRPLTPQEVGDFALHEIGHALGLGHAQPIEETTDLMGYGWLPTSTFPGVRPVLSACDIKALCVVWAWAFEGVAPYAPTESSISCS